MNKAQLISIGTILVAAVSWLTMTPSVPYLYPYSLTVVMPRMIASSLGLPPILSQLMGIFPFVFLYLIWSLVFLRSPFKITIIQRLIASLFVLLSVVVNIYSFSYGIKYQGELYTYVLYAYNFVLIAALCFVFWLNNRKPTIYNSAGFGIVLFAWLGWVAFPWLGEFP